MFIVTSNSPSIMSAEAVTTTLSQARKGDRGVVTRIDADRALGGHDLERRLLEIGFVEGAKIEVLHEGLIGRDPIAVRIDDMRVALRRREAACISIERDV